MEYADELALGSMDKRLWLPTTVKEIEALGWDRPDVILFSAMPTSTTLPSVQP